MKPAKTENLDRILAAEEALSPSSGFVASVMDRVRQEGTVPEPIPFPWKRALPGMMVAALGLIWCVVKLVQTGTAAAPIVISIPSNVPGAFSVADAGWTAAALGASVLSWLLARRMVGSSGLN
jgi:hypothetical protein